MCCTHTQSFFLFGADWVHRVRFSSVFSCSSTAVSFVILTNGTIISTLKCVTNILHAGATGIKYGKPPPPQKCPTSSLFTLQRFKWLQTELPETVVNSWHSKFPWSQLAYKKDFPFFPLKIMSSPGTVQMPQIRQIRDLFWPTNEKTSPSSPWGPQDWVTPYTRCQFLKRLHWFP